MLFVTQLAVRRAGSQWSFVSVGRTKGNLISSYPFYGYSDYSCSTKLPKLAHSCYIFFFCVCSWNRAEVRVSFGPCAPCNGQSILTRNVSISTVGPHISLSLGPKAASPNIAAENNFTVSLGDGCDQATGSMLCRSGKFSARRERSRTAGHHQVP